MGCRYLQSSWMWWWYTTRQQGTLFEMGAAEEEASWIGSRFSSRLTTLFSFWYPFPLSLSSSHGRSTWSWALSSRKVQPPDTRRIRQDSHCIREAVRLPDQHTHCQLHYHGPVAAPGSRVANCFITHRRQQWGWLDSTAYQYHIREHRECRYPLHMYPSSHAA